MERQYQEIYGGTVDVSREEETLKYGLTETGTLSERGLRSTVEQIRNEFLDSALRTQKIIGKPISLEYTIYEISEKK
ncbi:MAG: hypothetical protein Q7J54_04895 [Candidatus Woesearchaeota archaeon]|nr:hypothetical protein [Candidatus Woesearchaeota archaeon]